MNTLYGVKNILKKSNTSYEVLWTDGSSTWEPLENLCCYDLLLRFEIHFASEHVRRLSGQSPIAVELLDDYIAVQW